MSVVVTSRFRGAVRVQSGQLVMGTAPKRGHERRGAEAELDIATLLRVVAPSPEKKNSNGRRGRMGSGDARLGVLSCINHELDKLVGPTLWVPPSVQVVT